MSPARPLSYDRVHELHQGGQSIRQIAQRLDMARETVTHYLHEESFPDCKPSRPHRGQMAGYRDYIDRRLGEGCQSAAELHRELTANGVDVSYYAVRRFVRRRLIATGQQRLRENSANEPMPKAPSARQLSFTVIRKPQERDADEQARIEILGSVDGELAGAVELAAQFAAMIRRILTQSLSVWLSKAEASACAEMRGFARSLRQDEKAVQAGMTEPWSNGPVEGQVNRLKMIKRQMDGRAGFELLRARVLTAA